MHRLLRANAHNGYGKAIEVDLQRVSKRNKKTNKYNTIYKQLWINLAML